MLYLPILSLIRQNEQGVSGRHTGNQLIIVERKKRAETSETASSSSNGTSVIEEAPGTKTVCN